MGFKYETHLHTAETSKCSRSGGAEMARYFHREGYAGIFVTDHFLNGNTTVSPDLPWKERIRDFQHGYEAAAEEGAKLGLDVFFAWEYSYGWAHFLTYGLGADWLFANPDLLEWQVGRYIDEVHEAGGFVVHAHPFRVTGNPVMRMIPHGVDAVEIVNAGNSADDNRLAAAYAASLSLPVTAGSDIHRVGAARRAGVLTDRRLTDGRDYMQAVLAREVRVFADIPAAR